MIHTVLYILPFISLCRGANILAFLPMPSYSHQIAYTHIWKELSLRGHKVTLVSPNPLKDPNLTNLTEIDMNWTYDTMKNYSSLIQEKFTMWNVHQISHKVMMSVSEAYLSHVEIQNLLLETNKFGVVLVEFLYPELLAFGKIFNCPTILISSLDVPTIFHLMAGNPTNSIVYPEIGCTFYGFLNFKERIISTIYMWYITYFYYYEAFYQKTQLIEKYLNISTTVYELLNDVDLMFLNVNPILQTVRALGPASITISGDKGVLSSSTLPKDVADFLDNAKNGFIYFSLGSNVMSKDLNKESLQAIIETLEELPYRVLWKFELDELPNKPKNVKIIKWAPQVAVLSHKNIKVFITQGGLQSIEDAFYREVPVVLIPFFGDQEHNSKVVESKGFGIIVDRKPLLNKTDLKNAILEVINNPKYKNTVKRLKKLALDSPMTGLEKAVWWTEYVIRNKDAKHLRNPVADIPFYQYYLVDVIGFFVLLIISTFIFIYFTLKTVYNKIMKCVIFRFLPTSAQSKIKVQ